MAKILAPNKQYTGISASVPFVNGMGETDNPGLIEWFQEKGYEVVEEDLEEELKEPDPEANPKPLEEMKKEDLKELAAELGIELPSRATNEQIIQLIKAKQEADKEE